MKAVLNLLAPDTVRERLLGIPLHGWGLSLVGYYGSGLPYTPTNTLREQTEIAPNQARLPAFVNLDFRLRKRMKPADSSIRCFLKSGTCSTAETS